MLRKAAFAVLVLALVPATVHAGDHHHSHHGSHESGCSHSSSSSSSAGTHTVHHTPSVPAGHLHRVFVTSEARTGAIGSLAAADAVCQSAATAGGLSGTFRAWISIDSVDAFDRITSGSEWYTTGGSLAFSSKSELRGPSKSDLLDEHGNRLTDLATVPVWSGSDTLGVASGENCDDWTSDSAEASGTTGSARALDPAWGGGDAPIRCDQKARLVCFEM